jgi:hypothetical protein
MLRARSLTVCRKTCAAFRTRSNKLAIAASYATLQLYSGLDGDQTLEIIAPALDAGRRKQILHDQGKIYEDKYLDSVKAFRGMRKVFEALTRRGGRMALATDCKGPALRRHLSLSP